MIQYENPPLDLMRTEMSHFFRGRGQQNPQESKGRTATRLLPDTTWDNEPLPAGIPPEGKVVVTISRQFGSGGAEVGHIVAQENGLLYVDRALIGEVARRHRAVRSLVLRCDLLL